MLNIIILYVIIIRILIITILTFYMAGGEACTLISGKQQRSEEDGESVILVRREAKCVSGLELKLHDHPKLTQAQTCFSVYIPRPSQLSYCSLLLTHLSFFRCSIQDLARRETNVSSGDT